MDVTRRQSASEKLGNTCWSQVILQRLPTELLEKLETRVITKFYLGGQEGVTRDNKQGLIDMFTDSYFAYPNTEAVKLHAQASAPIYNYLLSYRGSISLSSVYTAGDVEASKVIHLLTPIFILVCFCITI